MSYSYGADGQLAVRTDAKGQQVRYTYDLYGRMVQVSRFPNGVSEDTGQRVDYYYDSNPIDSNYSGYSAGRLAAVRFNGTWAASYEYAYDMAWRLTGKR